MSSEIISVLMKKVDICSKKRTYGSPTMLLICDLCKSE